VKFLYSDTQDYVDPGYDFLNDRNAPKRKRYWDDRYAHEMMDPAPYDGLLVSMSAIRSAPGLKSGQSKYSLAEEQRFLRDGARQFLRFGGPRFSKSMLMGDCGAFAYANLNEPAYTPDEVVEFYVDAGFTHGCSPDHIIFECDPDNPSREAMSDNVRNRYDITQQNAKAFLDLVIREGRPFEPMGPVQGWSPESMAQAAADLEKMGYRYLAVGGLVPLKTEMIHLVLSAIRQKIRPETQLHLLGFAKADKIHEFVQYRIASFDSTSPLLRAFKDAKANYYLEAPNGGIEYFAAVRIPQAIENPRLMQAVKSGTFKAEELLKLEKRALDAIRGYDKAQVSFDSAVAVLDEYQNILTHDSQDSEGVRNRALESSRDQLHRTLAEKPWKRCKCAVCKDAGVEVIIFRSSNRNKRRGFHNLGVYFGHLRNTLRDA